MARDKRVVARMNETGESWSAALGFNIIGHSGGISGDIESAVISDDEHGEHIELGLRVKPEQVEYLPEHRPLEVELSKTTLARLARRMPKR